jgi:hypothetical protein
MCVCGRHSRLLLRLALRSLCQRMEVHRSRAEVALQQEHRLAQGPRCRQLPSSHPSPWLRSRLSSWWPPRQHTFAHSARIFHLPLRTDVLKPANAPETHCSAPASLSAWPRVRRSLARVVDVQRELQRLVDACSTDEGCPQQKSQIERR